MHIKLRQHREGKGISQAEMGRMLSISQPQYQRKEIGFSPFSADEQKLLSEYFDKPIDELLTDLGFSQNNHKQKGGVAAIYYVVDKLVDEGKKLNSYLKEQLKEEKKENKRLKEELEELRKTTKPS